VDSDEKFTLGGSEFQTFTTRSVKKRSDEYYTESAICTVCTCSREY